MSPSIPARFEQVAAARPDQWAMLTAENRITYRQLDEASDRIAQAIRRRRGDSSQSIAVLAKQGIFAAIATLGVLKAGKILVPLDPGYPIDRLLYMLNDSGATLIVSDECHLGRADELSGGKLPVLSLNHAEADAPLSLPPITIDPEAFACIYYSSGSTGQPKGIVRSHRFWLHNVSHFGDAVQITAQDRWSWLQSYSFSSSATDLMCPLLHGATCCPWNVADKGLSDLAAWFTEAEVTIVSWMVTPFRTFASTLGPQDKLNKVRLMMFGGENLYTREFCCFREHFSPACEFINQMGVTETGLIRLFHFNRQTVLPKGVIPVGYAFPDKDVVILDETGQEAPAGEIGQIAVRSQFLASGYWRRDDLTREKFLANPGNPLERTYLTGDLGQLASDGCLEYVGRADSQVKLRGFRIELGEIESILRQHASVAECVVALREDRPGEKRLVAYFIPTAEAEVRISELRSHLRKRLPDYMEPAAFMRLSEFPLTPNGKIDRQTLPPPDELRPELEHDYVAPHSTPEAQLAIIWRELLGIEQIGIHDNFFDLGGHSLMAARMAGMVKQRMGKQTPLATIFSKPTIAELARFIESDQLSNLDLLEPLRTTGSQATVLYFGVDKQPPIMEFVPPEHSLFWCKLEHMEGKRLRYSTIEELADHYCRELSTAAATGPYVLCGYSFGGLVAVEVARQLYARQRADTLLFLVEPAAPQGSGIATESTTGTHSSKIVDLRRQLRSLPAGQRLSLVHSKARGFMSHVARWSRHGLSLAGLHAFDRWLKRCYCELRLCFKCDIPVGLRWLYAHNQYLKAIRQYIPGPIPGRLILVQRPDYDNGALLDQLTEGTPCLHVFDAPDHEAIVNERRYVAQWKELLRASLASLSMTSQPDNAPLVSRCSP